MNPRGGVKRIGILTGGGDCAGINAVIRVGTKKAIYKCGMEVVGIRDGYLGLIEDRMIQLTDRDVSGILSQGGTILGTSNRVDPFQFSEKRGGTWVTRDISDLVVKNYRKHGLDALICIGGDGTLKVAEKLIHKGLRIIGVPKTIDNDICETDITFGFDTAVFNATEAIDKIHDTAESHHRAMVIETMGRYAGWIALIAGLASGGDIILIPEIPYRMDGICGKIKERKQRGKHFSIIVVAEGARPEGGEVTVRKVVEGSPEPIRLGGIGNIIADEIEEHTGIESRVAVLGYLQRGGSPTAFDRVLATQLGNGAIDLIKTGQFGHMVCLTGGRISSVPIEKAVEKLKLVPIDSPFIAAAKAIDVSFGD
jgi:6-phosphofructokinase 1